MPDPVQPERPAKAILSIFVQLQEAHQEALRLIERVEQHHVGLEVDPRVTAHVLEVAARTIQQHAALIREHLEKHADTYTPGIPLSVT